MNNLQLVAKYIGQVVNDTIVDFGSCDNHCLVSSKQVWHLTEDDVNNVANVIRAGSYPTEKVIAKFNQKFLTFTK